MIQHIICLTSFITFLIGLGALACGDWQKFHLKRAGVLLATTCTGWTAFALCTAPAALECNADAAMCASVGFYIIAKNVSLAVFILAYCRDAVAFKNTERRGWKNMMRSSSNLRP